MPVPVLAAVVVELAVAAVLDVELFAVVFAADFEFGFDMSLVAVQPCF